MESELEVSIQSRNYPLVDSYALVPELDLSPNRHLYTCRKKPTTAPLVCSRVASGDAFHGIDDDYSYAMTSVADLSVKCDEDWVVRRFQTPVRLLL